MDWTDTNKLVALAERLVVVLEKIANEGIKIYVHDVPPPTPVYKQSTWVPPNTTGDRNA